MDRTERLIRNCLATGFAVLGLLVVFAVPASRELIAGNPVMFITLATAITLLGAFFITSAFVAIRITKV